MPRYNSPPDGRKLYTTNEAKAASGVCRATLSRHLRFMLDAGLCYRASEKKTSPLYYTEAGIRFLGTRKNAGRGASTVPEAQVARYILENWGVKSVAEMALDLDVPSELVLVWAKSLGQEVKDE